MRVNLIGNFAPNSGLTHDAMIIRGLLTAVYGEPQIRKVNHFFPQCEEAEMNIFLEVINPSLFSYAAKNIWIPNHEWTCRTWLPYLKMVDEVWVKTKEAETIFSEYRPVRYLGWTSIDKIFNPKKNYHKGIVLVGKNNYSNPKPVIQAYYKIKRENLNLYALLPSLVIPHYPDEVKFFVPPELTDKIEVISRILSESEYDTLLSECGLAICMSAAEGFGHAVNEAMSSGCNLILSPILAFRELSFEKAVFVAQSKSAEHPNWLGTLVDVSVDDLILKLKQYISGDMVWKKNVSERMRTIYETRHSSFVNGTKTVLETFKTDQGYVLSDTLPKEEDLPNVSIITLTYNRRLFMPLAQYSYMIQSYPEDKLEWVIVDDGEDPIEDTLFGISNIKYVRLDQKTSIGEKRNIGVQNATYDTLVMMDDDDVYPNNSILHRVAMMLKEPKKECTFCTTIPCYDIQKFKSFMNVPPITLTMSKRVSEATLCFTRSFWEDCHFTSIQIAEGDAFIHGREERCREVSPQDVIVSLTHSANTSSRKVPDGEPNGCHYGFNEKLFTVVTELGQQLNTSCQKASDGGVTYGATCGGDHPSQAPQHQPPQP